MTLLILDVDGVLTDGTKTYDVTGKVISKRFCDTDFTYIKLIKEKPFWNVIWLSGDRRVNAGIAHDRQIPFFYSPSKTHNKEDFLPFLLKRYMTDKENTYFIGDGYYDVGLLQALPFENRYCPSTAEHIVKDVVPRDNVLRAAGTGIVEDFYYDKFDS